MPAYLAASVAALVRGRDCYFDNRFEVAAFRAESSSELNGESSRCSM